MKSVLGIDGMHPKLEAYLIKHNMLIIIMLIKDGTFKIKVGEENWTEGSYNDPYCSLVGSGS